ncbi:MAG: hypothetical protein V2A73_18405 [Pseudomonadota bacterium]
MSSACHWSILPLAVQVSYWYVLSWIFGVQNSEMGKRLFRIAFSPRLG